MLLLLLLWFLLFPLLILSVPGRIFFTGVYSQTIYSIGELALLPPYHNLLLLRNHTTDD